jgi:hypothetical protein
MKKLPLFLVKFSLPILSIVFQPQLASFLGEYIFVYSIGLMYSFLYYSIFNSNHQASILFSILGPMAIVLVCYIFIWRKEYNLGLFLLLLGLSFGLLLVYLQNYLITYISEHNTKLLK